MNVDELKRDSFRSLQYAIILLSAIVVIGTLGYMVIEDYTF